MNFVSQQYDVPGMSSPQFKSRKWYVCTLCYNYEMNQLKGTQDFSDNLELTNNDNESVKAMELRLSLDSLYMQDGSDTNTPQSASQNVNSEVFSEDESVVSHNRNAVREVFNAVFHILNIQTITDM